MDYCKGLSVRRGIKSSEKKFSILVRPYFTQSASLILEAINIAMYGAFYHKGLFYIVGGYTYERSPKYNAIIASFNLVQGVWSMAGKLKQVIG